MANSSRSQVYSPVPLQERQIRLCVINPGPRDAPVSCTLQTVVLDHDVPYETLSYVWGPATDNVPIAVNGGTLTVTRNLEGILKYLRRRNVARPVWIDAICINQEDMDERSRQVQIMADIYSMATSTVCWLGQHPELLAAMRIAELGLREIEGMERDVDPDFLGREIVDMSVVAQFGSDPKSSHWKPRQDNLLHTDEVVRQSLGLLLGHAALPGEVPERNYWARSWTVQEFARSRKLFLQAEDIIIDFDLVQKFEEFELYHVGDDEKGLAFEMQVTLRPKNARKPGDFGTPLLETLTSYRNRYATDARDKVYAFFSLSDMAGFHEEDVKVDYKRSIREVFTLAAVGIIRSTLKLNVICHRALGEVTEAHGLPSWVPDWSFMGTKTDVHPTSDGGGQAEAEFWSFDDLTILSVQGVVIGRVAAATKPKSTLFTAASSATDLRDGTDLVRGLADEFRDLEKRARSRVAVNVFESILGAANDKVNGWHPCWKALDMTIYKRSRGPWTPCRRDVAAVYDRVTAASEYLLKGDMLTRYAALATCTAGGGRGALVAFEDSDPGYRRLRLSGRTRHQEEQKAAYVERGKQMDSDEDDRVLQKY